MSKIENSHLIQVYTSSNSIWRGHDTSVIKFDVKVDKRFLVQHNNYDHNHNHSFASTMSSTTNHNDNGLFAQQNDEEQPKLNHYQLIAYVEDYNTKSTYWGRALGLRFLNDSPNHGNHSSDNNDEDQSWDSNEGDNKNPTIHIGSDPYFQLVASIPRDAFQDGDEIRIIVEAVPLFDSDSCLYTFFGASRVIS